MKNIKILKNVEEINIKKLKKIWKYNKNCKLIMPKRLNRQEIRKIADYFLLDIDGLALLIFDELLEYKEVDDDIIKRIFDTGDKACINSISMREDISDEMINRCIATGDITVLEHLVFNKNLSEQYYRKILEIYHEDKEIIDSINLCWEIRKGENK